MAPVDPGPGGPVAPGPEPSASLSGSGAAPSSPGGDAGWGGWISGGPSAAAPWRADRQARRDARRADRGVGSVFWGALLVLVGAVLLGSELVPGFDPDVAWPVLLVAFGVLLVAASIRRAPADS